MMNFSESITIFNVRFVQIKKYTHLLLIFLAIHIAHAQKNEIAGPWKFLKGDDTLFSNNAFSDKTWKDIQLPMVSHTTPGYAWYRKEVVIPSLLKEPSKKYGYLAITIGCFDDVGQFYFNGEMIGQKGTIAPFQSAWGQTAQFIVPIKKVNWGKKNLIAVRLYSPDNIGGGIHKGPFFMEPAERKLGDFVSVSVKTEYAENSIKGSVNLTNTGEIDSKGKINYIIADKDNILLKGVIPGIVVKKNEIKTVNFNHPLPANDYYEISYTFQDTLLNESISKVNFFNSKNEPAIATVPRKLITGYLVDDSFYHLTVYDGSQKVTGWDIDTTGGNGWEVEFGTWFKIIDKSSSKGVCMKKRFLKQREGEVTWEFRFMSPRSIHNTLFQICNDTTPVVRLLIENNKLCFNNAAQPMQTLIPLKEYGVKIVMNLSTGKCTGYVNGKYTGEYDLLNHKGGINYITLKTGNTEKGELYLDPVQVYKGYYAYERFVGVGAESLPEDWVTTNGAIAQELDCQAKPDVYSLKMNDYSEKEVVTFSKKVDPIKQKVWFDYRFYSPGTAEGFNASIGTDKKKIMILVQNSQIGYVNDKGQFQAVHHYTPNLWHHIVLCTDPVTGLTDIWVNDKLKKQQINLSPINAITSVAFSTGRESKSIVWLDDILLYPWQPEPSDYVPVPIPVKHDPYIIGMQSCPLWKEGSHVGWDFILPIADVRKPVLGWYDEGKPETSDWQTKFMVEHGVDFNLYCWYQSHLSQRNPIKRSLLDFDLHEGFFYSKYSNQLKFAIMYENWAVGSAGYKHLTENVFPFWIEYYLKDPRYMVIDNKPVITIYSARKLEAQLGSLEMAKKALIFLRNKCKEIGFDDAILLCKYRDTDPKEIEYIRSMGFDNIYSYTWYTGETAPQKRKMEAQYKVGMPLIASPSMGWEPSAWKLFSGDPPSIASPRQFKQTLLWVKDTLMKKMPVNSLSSKMILLDNWNEYGEGHFIVPASAFGFGYLDAIRSVFSIGSKHADTYPTEQQKARINILYMRGYKEE